MVISGFVSKRSYHDYVQGGGEHGLKAGTGADPGNVKRGAEIQKGGGRVVDITRKYPKIT